MDQISRGSMTDEYGKSYTIAIKGHLAGHWSDWLGGLEITQDKCGYSILTGPVRDQAALFGILNQIRDLGLPLISITSMKSAE